MTAGSCFVMWLGEQITERGIGNGASLIIVGGIVAGVPGSIGALRNLVETGEMSLLEIALFGVFMVLVVAAIVFVERGLRKVPINYAKRVARRGAGETAAPQAAHLPLKVNVAGVVPAIFASSVIMIPGTIGAFYNHPLFAWLSAQFVPGGWIYNATYVLLVVFFSFFYTAVSFSPMDLADNLRRNGGYIPGHRPGADTVTFLDRLILRLTTGGSLYLAAVCILPTILISEYGLPFYFGGTGLLIVIGVALDTVAQIESYLLTDEYSDVAIASGGRREFGV
jgi:preprotein translocase subunit SecY